MPDFFSYASWALYTMYRSRAFLIVEVRELAWRVTVTFFATPFFWFAITAGPPPFRRPPATFPFDLFGFREEEARVLPPRIFVSQVPFRIHFFFILCFPTQTPWIREELFFDMFTQLSFLCGFLSFSPRSETFCQSFPCRDAPSYKMTCTDLPSSRFQSLFRRGKIFFSLFGRL